MRTVGLALAALVLVVLWSACGSGEPQETTTELRLVTWKPNQPAVWEEIYRRFATAHPEIELEREIGPHSSTAFHDLLTQKLKNRSRDVDVFLMDVIWPPEFAAAGWAEPLDDRLGAGEREAFFAGSILANTYEDRLYGMPLYLDAGLLYYREDLLEKHGFEPPRTWEELVSQAQKIVAAERAEGHEMVGFSAQLKQYEGLVCNLLEFVLGAGGRLIDPATGTSALARPPALAAVRFVRDSIVGEVAPRGVLTYEEPESLALFVQGRAVFHRNWPYAWAVANDPARSAVAGRVGIAPLPAFEGGQSHATLGGWQVGISRFSEKKDAAWELVRFLTGSEIQELLAVEAGLAPTRKALYDDPEVLTAQPQLARMREAFLGAHPRPRTPLYPAVSNVLQRYFSTALAGEDGDLAAAAERASADIDRLLAMAREGEAPAP